MNKRTGIIRTLSAILGCLMALTLAFGLSACNGKAGEEELIRNEVATFLDVFKNPSIEKLQEYTGEDEIDLSSIEEYGIDMDQFLKHSFGHFDYTINSVTIDGDRATVAVSLTNANLETAAEAAGTALTESEEDFSDVLGSEDAIKLFMQRFFEEFYAQIDASEDMVTTDAEIKLNKVDGTWQLDETDIKEVYSAMYGGLNF